MPQPSTSLVLDMARQQLAQAGIVLYVTKKRVKNINFRLKPYALMVSVPMSISPSQIAQSVDKRVSWALDNHPQVLARYHRKQTPKPKASTSDSPILLWGIEQSLRLNHDEKIAYYRQQLTEVNPSLFDKWQPIVGATANEVRLKKCIRAGAVVTRVRAEFGYPYIFPLTRLNAPNTSSSMSCVICIMPITARRFGKR